MTDYSFMEETVNKICYSLENEGKKWRNTTYTLDGMGFELWKNGEGNNPIVEVWNGYSSNRVFSSDQGCRIRDSYNIYKNKCASEAQKEIINKMKPTRKKTVDKVIESENKDYIEPASAKWWEFWK